MKKRLKMAIGVVLALIGICIAAVSIFVVGPCRLSQLSRVTGTYSEFVEQDQTFRGVVIVHGIRLEDGRVFVIGSDTETAFNQDAFLASVAPGDSIELVVRRDGTEEPAVLAVYHDGREFMDFEQSQSARQTNQTLGIILGALLLLAGLAFFASCFRKRNTG